MNLQLTAAGGLVDDTAESLRQARAVVAQLEGTDHAELARHVAALCDNAAMFAEQLERDVESALAS